MTVNRTTIEMRGHFNSECLTALFAANFGFSSITIKASENTPAKYDSHFFTVSSNDFLLSALNSECGVTTRKGQKDKNLAKKDTDSDFVIFVGFR